MALCGWASSDERGKYTGGAAGDQKQTSTSGNDTKGEVKVGSWYNFGQTFVIRYKDPKKAKRHAIALLAICNNKHVGYDMGLKDRQTLRAALKEVGNDPVKIKTNCETDCSMLQDECARLAGALTTVVGTGQMKATYGKDDDFIILTDKKYLTSGDYLLEGDMSVNPGHHVIGSIMDGSKAKNESRSLSSNKTTSVKKVYYYPKYTGKSKSLVDALNEVGAKESRADIAKANGIANYTKSAIQNEKLLTLLKEGKLVKP